ncbi:uncharacterized protein J7T54_001054 [Emericellopsis cladophorae]|uniref:Uncharacterized protein n=1 Tax=Emericellopsis cladophorae TaxID=2686198 RepID=A0A9P9XZI8_9HYPO|nr:uncharacterized protein J7T54_001054 [Emericellopsis cladophorae]KAI6780746.1 hypothetical protein J7T54_001054 [Emericellopsis cladophorae]
MAVTAPDGTQAALDPIDANPPVAPGKRKRDSAEADGITDNEQDTKAAIGTEIRRDQTALIDSCFRVLQSFDLEPSLLKRPLPDTTPDDEPETKRQKSAEPPTLRSIDDKFTGHFYAHVSDLVNDVAAVVKSSLAEAESQGSSGADLVARIRDFRTKAVGLLRREEAYPQTSSGSANDLDDDSGAREVLSLFGLAPQEKRLFSSLADSRAAHLSDANLPAGISLTRVYPSTSQERVLTLGELFPAPRALPALQPPKQPKTQAKGNQLDFYHPELTDKSQYWSNSYFGSKLSAGHYLDYSHATPSASAKARQHERVKSLAGKKPSATEVQMSEMETLFRGAFSSFAPCKDDSTAVVPASVAGRVWWQRAGQQNFQNMIEIDYYGLDDGNQNADEVDLDESAVREAIDNWDEAVVDPTLEDAMGAKRDDAEKEVEEILDEVSDLIETLASYQRIRNLNLPNSQNRQSSDPVAGDMLATAGPQVAEEERATYQVLKAQLSLIIKTLPPYAVAKLNGDQLNDLLISTKLEVSTDQYKGVMEEDDAAAQARLRAQQTAPASQRQPQRTPSISYANHYQPSNQYGTPQRPPSQSQQYYRGGPTPGFHGNYQQQRQQYPTASTPQQRPPSNQYSRPNGFPSQYASQLSKAQTPFGHQNMPQYANQQQRQQYGQMAQQGTPGTSRFSQYQTPSYPQQQQQQQQHQAGTPGQGTFSQYTNGSGVQHQQGLSPSPRMQHHQPPQRYGTPNQGPRYQGGSASQPPAQQQPTQQSLGYHTVMPESQQQAVLEQARARVTAHERAANHMDKSVAVPPRANSGTPTPLGANGTPIPRKVTPVPLPQMVAHQQQQKPS